MSTENDFTPEKWAEHSSFQSDDDIRAGLELAELRMETQSKAKQIRKLHERVKSLENQLGIREDLRGIDAEALPIAKKSKGSAHEAVACVAFSDWHAEERVDPQTVNGLNEYDLDIFQARAAKAFQKTLRLVEVHRRDGMVIRQLVVGLLGDLMTGRLHEDQTMTNTAGTPQAIRVLSKTIKAGLKLLLEQGNFDRIVVPCVTGNHGRMTRKRLYGADHQASFETQLYYDLEDHFEDQGEKRIEFVVSPGTFAYTEVLGHRIRWTHGDSFGYQGGIGGVLVGARRMVYTKWNAASHADLTVMGHWHTLVWDSEIIVNGSLIGPSAYGVAKAGAERPQQAFWLMDERWGRSAMHPIFVTDRWPMEGDSPSAKKTGSG